MTHGLREATALYSPQRAYGMPLANVNLLHALQKILEGVDELGFGALEGDKPCTMGVFLRDVCKTDLTAGSYCHDYFSIIPIVNDKYGPCEDNRNRRNRMLAWVKERLRAEDGRGYRTSLSEQEIQEMTIMPLRNIPYSFTFNYRRKYGPQHEMKKPNPCTFTRRFLWWAKLWCRDPKPKVLANVYNEVKTYERYA